MDQLGIAGTMAADVAFYILALAGIAYLTLALWQVRRFCVNASPMAPHRPGITVLKPLCGDEPRLYQCLRSFCAQDYPQLQIIFGVRDANDPAIAVVKRLQREFPQRDLVLVQDARIHGANLKVSNLMNMAHAIRHPVIAIADSDVDIATDCLSRVVSSLAAPHVGAVTCLYQGAPNHSTMSQLGALYINDWFLPSVLVDVGLNGTDGCFGALTLIRTQALRDVGGLSALSDYLAEDHRLGRLIRDAGWTLALSDLPVNTMVEESSLSTLLSHEIRWGRTVRACRPLDHVLSLVTFPLPVLVLLFCYSPSWTALAVLALHGGLRTGLHYAVHARFPLPAPVTPWLVPMRECLCGLVWAISLLKGTVSWRGRTFTVDSDGRLMPLLAPQPMHSPQLHPMLAGE